MIPSQIPTRNQDAWAARPHTLTRPLEEFWAYRFLEPSDGNEDFTAPPRDAARFSLHGLEGCWLPFGGGQRMCPGRHFAKNEILGTFALLFTRYDLQLIDSNQAKVVKPDHRRVLLVGLPPSSKVSVRLRAKCGRGRC